MRFFKKSVYLEIVDLIVDEFDMHIAFLPNMAKCKCLYKRYQN